MHHRTNPSPSALFSVGSSHPSSSTHTEREQRDREHRPRSDELRDRAGGPERRERTRSGVASDDRVGSTSGYGPTSSGSGGTAAESNAGTNRGSGGVDNPYVYPLSLVPRQIISILYPSTLAC
jgi:hypothetical protein